MAHTLLGIASGATSEAVKLNAIRDALDRAVVPAKDVEAVEVKPDERLINDIAGIATISAARAESRSQFPATACTSMVPEGLDNIQLPF
jgi:hypothetical protein